MLTTFAIYVENKPGVLTRVSSLFRRRAFNIESLTVGHTETPGVSRMTVAVETDELSARRLEAHVYKLVNVLRIENITAAPAVFRDLAMIKVAANSESRTHIIPGKTPQQKQLATWICKKVYDLRNDFLHGNDVEGSALMLNGKPIIDFAACLYRLALTGFLNLHFNVPVPAGEDAEALGAFINQRMRFNKFQVAYENALLTAI
jgi:acetolactate synthase small subunit